MESEAEPVSASASDAAAGAAEHDPAGDGRPGPLDLTVPVGPLAPANARAAVAGWLSGRVADGVIEDARLLVSELVTNCVQHGRLAADAPVRISAHVAGDVLRLEVHDPGRHGSVRRRVGNPSGGGYGLSLLELLATRWGVDRATGTHVWFELASAAA